MTTVAVRKNSKTYDMVYIGVFAVLMAICSWISIPVAIPFTLQTLGVCLCGGILGGKRGIMVILVYILLGAAGLPVFAGFSSGIGVLLGPTGGYIIGFIFSMLVMWGIEAVAGRKTWVMAFAMIAAIIACYVFGTVWFMIVYGRNGGQISLGAALGMCVIPFLLPDLLKVALALGITKRLEKAIRL